MARKHARTGFTPKLITVAVASCFAAGAVLANPTAPTVVSGTATFLKNGNLLQITNSPSSIINWQSFSIGANEITRFIQQSSASAVLNRVTTQDPSVILGALQSNGRVFLINPNGILFGRGSQVDVAGLVATSLNLSNVDFLAGRLNFAAVPGAGSVVNQGNINAGQGGSVYLVGPAVTNNGIITSPAGEVVLAAGNSVELVSPGTPNLKVEILAPDNQALNLGQIVTESGRIGIYAGLITNSGTLRADSVVAGADGSIKLVATKNVTLEPTSVISASGAKGGRIDVLGSETANIAGRLDASAPNGGDGGFIETSAHSVKIADGTVVTTVAPFGKSGTWLIDPNDFYIAGPTCVIPVASVCDISGATLSSNLGLGSVTITSDQGVTSLGFGDIYVNDTVSWVNGGSLMLLARGQVRVNSPITHTGTGGNISLYAGWDTINTTTPTVSTSNFGRINLGAAVSTTGNMALVASTGVGGSGVSSAVGVTANQLIIDGGEGGVFLGDASTTNMVNVLAGSVLSAPAPNAGFMFKNGKSLEIGSVTSPAGNLTRNGITTNNGIIDVTLPVAGSNLMVNQPVVSVSSPFSTGLGAAVTLNATGDITVNVLVKAQTVNDLVGGSGLADLFITSSAGNVRISGTGSVLVQTATSTTTGTFPTGDIFADGGPAQAFITATTGSITVDGRATITATAGNGSSTSGGVIASTGSASAIGSSGEIELNAGNGITLNGNISAQGGNGGSATATNGNAFANGGFADVFLDGGSGAVMVNGNISATGGKGGFATFTGSGFHQADGGGAEVFLSTSGPINVGAGGLTAIGGIGGSGSGLPPRNGGDAVIALVHAIPFIGECLGDCFVFGPAGNVQIDGNLTATGGARFNGGDGGNAFVAVLGNNITQTGSTQAMGSNGSNMGGFALIGYEAVGDITLSGGSITAAAGGTSPLLLGLLAGNNVTLGGNVAASGGVGTSGWFNSLNLPIPVSGTVPLDFSGIGIQAGNAIIGGSGMLSASVDQTIELRAVNGIGTQAIPVRIGFAPSSATGPNVHLRNTSTTTGDIAVSSTTNGIVMDGQFDGLLNSNSNGTYSLQVESGNIQLDIPFLPWDPSFQPGPQPLAAGQKVVMTSLAGNVIIGAGGSIATSGAGFTSLTGNNVTSTGSLAGLVNATANSGNVDLFQAASFTVGLLSATGFVLVTSTGADVTLGTIATGALTATSTGALNLGQGTVTGALIANSNGGAITQAGNLTVTGTAGITAGAAPITLTMAGNDFQGVVTLSNLGANAVSIADANTISFAPLTLGGAFTVTAPTIVLSDVTNTGFQQYNGPVFFNSSYTTNGGAFAVTGATTVGGNSTITAGAGNVTLSGAVNSEAGENNSLTINSSGMTTLPSTIGATQPLSSITTDSAGTASLGGNVTTTGAQAFNDLTGGGNITLASTGGGAIAANSAASTFPSTINTSGTVTLGGTTLGSSGTPVILTVTPSSLTLTQQTTAFFTSPAIPPVVTAPAGSSVSINGALILGAVVAVDQAAVDQAVNQVVAATNQQTDVITEGQSGGDVGSSDPKEEKDKKKLPICGGPG